MSFCDTILSPLTLVNQRRLTLLGKQTANGPLTSAGADLNTPGTRRVIISPFAEAVFVT